LDDGGSDLVGLFVVDDLLAVDGLFAVVGFFVMDAAAKEELIELTVAVFFGPARDGGFEMISHSLL